MKRALLPALLAGILFAFTPSSILHGQGTDLGTIRGTVTDIGGARVPKARVQVTDVSTNIARTINSGDQGNFEAAALPAGRYKVSVSAPGFGTSVVENVVLTGSDVATADVILRASESTTLTVTEAPSIDLEDSTLSDSIPPLAVIQLPRDSRDIFSFLYLNPNITQSGTSGAFKFLGGQSYGASFSVDGQRSNGGVFGTQTQTEPSLESVGELNVLSNGFSAEYAGIANIRVDTKRGSDHYHGSLFYNNKNSALAAWSLANKSAAASFQPTAFEPRYPTPFFNITDAGGSFGGPIPHLKKTFFFTAYEHNWTAQPITVGRINTLPHPSLIAGDFSGVSDGDKPDVPAGTILTAGEVATDTVGGLGLQFIRIPSRLLNADVQKLFSTYYPSISTAAPMDTLGRVIGYYTNIPGHSRQNLADMRIDHDFSDANRLYGVYHGGSETEALSEVASPTTGLGLQQTDRLNNTLSVSYTHVFTPHLVNEARGGFNRQYLFTHSNTTLGSFLKSIGFSSADQQAYGSVTGEGELNTYGEAAINITNFSGVSNGGRNTDRPLSQNLITFGDTLTWQLGRHDIRLGGDVVRNAALDGFTSGRGDPRGLITYSASGDSALADLLLGEPPNSVSYTPNARPAMDVYNWESGYYVQDDFRITERLTLNLGLRYDLFTPYTEVNDLMVNFDPNLTNPSTGTPGMFILPSAKTEAYLDPSVLSYGYVLASQSGLGVGRSLVRTDRTDINPRLGMAFQLTGKSVLRGGYGVFTPTSSAHVIRDPLATNTFNVTRTKHATTADPLEGWPTNPETAGTSPNVGGVVNGFGNTPTANNVPIDLKNPRLQQWNVTYERELPSMSSIRFSYIGAYIGGEILGRDLDMIAPSDNMFGNTIGDGVTICDPTQGDCAYDAADKARLRFPALGDYVTQFGNNGRGLTASFQTQIKHQSKGLLLSAAYTYLQQKSSGVDTDNDSLGGDAYNMINPNSDYGTDSFVSKHRVVAYGVVDIPVGRDRRFGSGMSRWEDDLIGGWQGTFNLFAKTGTGFTPYYSCADCDPVIPGNIASGAVDAQGDFNSPTFRAVQIGNYKSGIPKGYQWNPTAFGFPSLGSTLFSNPGNVRRDGLLGPGTYGINVGVHKSFAITHQIAFELGADIDNVLNHPLLSPDQNSSDDYANIGSLTMKLNPTTGQFLPIMAATDPAFIANPSLYSEFDANSDFGYNYQSVTQEDVNNSRAIRLRGRITF